ncbi:2-carboxy-1,4-naphthoquinone phytyltransferase [Sodalinema gerasimenkoae]|uniref:2-carboxy-1,4-naphthoquinone phytyltransferase n=1 Tax=Sodalinema gerasimenkoae TaxID=2862348 RepID=UPI00135B67F8|nr:2-carboxy-1,4-naphthoquinone phytyltransferase [Sodalinema gerasimenkoae]
MTTISSSATSFKLWFAAIKPPMYTVAIIPIWVGTAVAVAEQHLLNLRIFSTFVTAAILIIAWLNLSNDVFDSETGIDKNKSHSLVNLTGNKSLIFSLANLCLILGLAGIVAIAVWQQDLTILALILGCCALGYSYQGPPFRLGYQGLGEPICFLTFGPMALAAAYYSQTQSWQGLVNHPIPFLVASSFIGLSTSIILFCSHFHQVDDDQAAGKRSPIVRLGTQRGATLLSYVTGFIFLELAIAISLGYLSPWVFLTFLSLPIAIQLCRHVQRHHNQPQQVSNCKFIAVNLHFLSGLLLGISLTL